MTNLETQEELVTYRTRILETEKQASTLQLSLEHLHREILAKDEENKRIETQLQQTRAELESQLTIECRKNTALDQKISDLLLREKNLEKSLLRLEPLIEENEKLLAALKMKNASATVPPPPNPVMLAANVLQQTMQDKIAEIRSLNELQSGLRSKLNQDQQKESLAALLRVKDREITRLRSLADQVGTQHPKHRLLLKMLEQFENHRKTVEQALAQVEEPENP